MRKLLAAIFVFVVLALVAPPVHAYDPLSVPNNIYGIGVINHTDLEDVSNLVNVNGGDWGYVTIVITEADRNKEVWQKFLDDCRRLRLIPIVRVATKYEDGSWNIPKIEDIDSWVNFFNSLNWVTKNRYIIIGNEPNHAKEWGGTINPSEYANYLKTFAERLHNADSEYFVLNAGFDQDAPNSKSTMDEKKYIEEMVKAVPNVFNFIDGWSSHSYPNPGFSGATTATGRRSIKGYEWELSLVQKSLIHNMQDFPVFITETGWVQSKKNDQDEVANNMKYAFENVWMNDKRIVAVTPFLLNYTEEPFADFSWKNSDGSYFKIYSVIQEMQKKKGGPLQRISGEVIFNFLNPLMVRNTNHSGFSVVKNTGQAIWTQGESNIINNSEVEIEISNTKFDQIEPFSTGLVTYTLKSPESARVFNVRLGFYVRGERIGDVMNGKIISF